MYSATQIVLAMCASAPTPSKPILGAGLCVRHAPQVERRLPYSRKRLKEFADGIGGGQRVFFFFFCTRR